MAMKGRIVPLRSSIANITPGHREVFMGCSGFEDRCAYSATHLAPAYRSSCTYILTFTYSEETHLNRRELLYQTIESNLRRHSDRLVTLGCNRIDPIDCIRKLDSIQSMKGFGIPGSDVTVDISVFTKQYLLVLLKYLEARKPSRIRLVYVEPPDYDVISRGAIGVYSVPGFSGAESGGKPTLLVEMLGFESERNRGLWERVSPDRTIFVVASPGFKAGWDQRALEANQRLISDVGAHELLRIDGRNPRMTSALIHDIHRRYHRDYNILLAPLATKLMTVGCYLALRTLRSIQAVYLVPKSYEEGGYFRGYSQAWAVS